MIEFQQQLRNQIDDPSLPGEQAASGGKDSLLDFVVILGACPHDPLGQTISAADFTFAFDRGEPRRVRMTGLPTRFYLKSGMYGGLNGWTHGEDKGESHVAHDVWDLNDAATRQTARTLSDHVVRLESGGEKGFGISEYGVAAGYPLYSAPQRFPAM